LAAGDARSARGISKLPPDDTAIAEFAASLLSAASFTSGFALTRGGLSF